MKTGTQLAIIVFALVAIGHLLRILNGVPVTIGDWDVPQWVSLLGILIPGLIAALLWRERN